MCGSLAILSVAGFLKVGANPEYPREVAGQTVSLFGLNWEIVDLPWARMGPTDIFWPIDIRWTTQAANAVDARGGYFLGTSLVVFFLISIWSLRDKEHNSLIYVSWIWLLVGFLLSLGSIFHGLAGPFLFYIIDNKI